MFAYRTSMNDTTGESPFYLFYGRHARLPAQVVHGDGSSTSVKLDYVQDMTRSLTQAQHRVQENIIREARKRRERQARDVRQISYQVGDMVWLYKPIRRAGRSPKLQMPWCGPYEVVTVLQGGMTYRIRLAGKRKSRVVVHHDRLKPYKQREECSAGREGRDQATSVGVETKLEQFKTKGDESVKDALAAETSDFVRHDDEVVEDAQEEHASNVEEVNEDIPDEATDESRGDIEGQNVGADTAEVREGVRRSQRRRRAPVRLDL